MAMVRENNDVTLYINGSVYGTPSSGLNAPTGGADGRLRVGAESSSTNFWTGAIASVKIISSALTAQQIRAEYERTLAFVDIPDEFTVSSGTFTQSLTVSGEPVTISLPWRGATLMSTSGSTIPDGTLITLPWDTPVINEGGFYNSSNPTRITVPAGIELARLNVGTRWASNATDERRTFIVANGTFQAAGPPVPGITATGIVGSSIIQAANGAATVQNTITPILTVREGDFFEVMVRQGSGGNLNLVVNNDLDVFFSIEVLK